MRIGQAIRNPMGGVDIKIPMGGEHICGSQQGPAPPRAIQDHNDWIEKEDFDIFLHAILMTHPGLEFLLETQARL